MPLKPLAVNQATGTVFHTPYPGPDAYSSVPPSRQMEELSKPYLCWNVSVVLLSTGNAGLTRTLSLVFPTSCAYQAWVGVWDCAADQVQFVAPLRAPWVHPARSKPPAPSKVSLNVCVVSTPVGAPRCSTRFASSAPLARSTERTT